MPAEIAASAVKPLIAAFAGALRACLTLAVAVAGLGVGARSWAAEGEAHAKAAYLANFAPFVVWPADKLPAGAPLVLCMLGADPFGAALDLVSGQMVGDHRMTLRRISRADEGRDCHILHIRRADSLSVEEALATVRGAPVLTVTDGADGPGPKGILHFVVSQSRVRFELDAPAAAAGRLTVSSKLKRLALPRRPES